MTASHKLPPSSVLEQVPKHGVIVMSGFGLRLNVQHGQLSAAWGIGEQRHHARISRVSRGLRRIVVIGSDGFATFDAIRWVSDIGASLVFLDRRGKLLFASTPTASSDAKLRRAQCLALANGTALKLSRELISQKLDGQAAIVRDMLGNSGAADAILRLKGQLAETDDIDSVRLVEAKAAKVYWSQFASVPIRWPRKDEDRVAVHWKIFGSRISPLTHSPRLAVNPPNACMNLIHALCEAECRIALIGLGLDPEIGILHCDVPYRSSLAHDLQELLRPKVEAFLLNWIQTECFRKTDFWEDRNGNCRIGSFLAKRLCETADTWRKFAAPIAEWLVREFWKTIRRPDMPFTTRLTQDNKRAVKGAAPMPAPQAPAAQHLCAGCGKIIPPASTNCSSCAVEGLRVRMVDVARKGRIASRSPLARARLSETQRRQTTDCHSWSPADHPKWLTEDVYTNQIQPRLPNYSLSKIASAMGVSIPYASDIRRGGRRPHPRHWLSLSQLVRYER